MIPGSNILNQALTVIAKQTITYYKSIGRFTNVIGQDVTAYAAPQIIVGSFQPIQRSLYIQYGLDFQKDYFVFYTSNNLIDISRNLSADQIDFNGDRYQCESKTKWFNLDGWVGILCCGITDAPANIDPLVFGFGPRNNDNQNFLNGNFDAG